LGAWKILGRRVGLPLAAVKKYTLEMRYIHAKCLLEMCFAALQRVWNDLNFVYND
jgi:hypothetical protein